MAIQAETITAQPRLAERMRAPRVCRGTPLPNQLTGSAAGRGGCRRGTRPIVQAGPIQPHKCDCARVARRPDQQPAPPRPEPTPPRPEPAPRPGRPQAPSPPRPASAPLQPPESPATASPSPPLTLQSTTMERGTERENDFYMTASSQQCSPQPANTRTHTRANAHTHRQGVPLKSPHVYPKSLF